MTALRSIVGSFFNPAAKKTAFLPISDVQYSSSQQKARTSMRGFAEVLCGMVSSSLTREALEGSARDFKFEIGNDEDLHKLHREMLLLNMWLTVHVCESQLPAREKCEECLDLLHRLVYERHCPANAENGFRQWRESMRSMYAVYNEAISSGHRAAALWVVADLFSCNLFGKVRKDPLVQARIGKHIEVSARHWRSAVKKYEIA